MFTSPIYTYLCLLCLQLICYNIVCHWLEQIGSGEDYQRPPQEIEVLHRKLLERLQTRNNRSDVLVTADSSTNERWENRTCADAGAVAAAAIIGRTVDANDNAAATEQVFVCCNTNTKLLALTLCAFSYSCLV